MTLAGNDSNHTETAEQRLIRIAWYYYHDGLTQGEIGDRLGLTRIKVSRLLESARRSGIIQVRINSRHQGCLEYEQRLQDFWGLGEVRVVPHLKAGNLNERLGQAAAQFLMQRLGNDDLLAVGWGETVSHAIERIGHMANDRNISLVSLTGGVASYVDGIRTANWNSTVHLLPAPLVVCEDTVASALMREPSVARILEMARYANYQLVGIGALSDQATVVRSGYITADEVEPLRRMGAVGDIVCQFFDEQGEVLDLALHRRVIGMRLEALNSLHTVIAVAGGDAKVPAIRAALTGKYVDILITDEKTAQTLLPEL